MRMTITSTTRLVEASGVKCRVWEGETELQECAAPSADVEAFPLRMIL